MGQNDFFGLPGEYLSKGQARFLFPPERHAPISGCDSAFIHAKYAHQLPHEKRLIFAKMFQQVCQQKRAALAMEEYNFLHDEAATK